MAIYNAGGSGGGGAAVIVSSTAPTDTSAIWIDSGNSYIAKVYTNGAWVALGAVWK